MSVENDGNVDSHGKLKGPDSEEIALDSPEVDGTSNDIKGKVEGTVAVEFDQRFAAFEQLMAEPGTPMIEFVRATMRLFSLHGLDFAGEVIPQVADLADKYNRDSDWRAQWYEAVREASPYDAPIVANIASKLRYNFKVDKKADAHALSDVEGSEVAARQSNLDAIENLPAELSKPLSPGERILYGDYSKYLDIKVERSHVRGIFKSIYDYSPALAYRGQEMIRMILNSGGSTTYLMEPFMLGVLGELDGTSNLFEDEPELAETIFLRMFEALNAKGAARVTIDWYADLGEKVELSSAFKPIVAKAHLQVAEYYEDIPLYWLAFKNYREAYRLDPKPEYLKKLDDVMFCDFDSDQNLTWRDLILKESGKATQGAAFKRVVEKQQQAKAQVPKKTLLNAGYYAANPAKPNAEDGKQPKLPDGVVPKRAPRRPGTILDAKVPPGIELVMTDPEANSGGLDDAWFRDPDQVIDEDLDQRTFAPPDLPKSTPKRILAARPGSTGSKVKYYLRRAATYALSLLSFFTSHDKPSDVDVLNDLMPAAPVAGAEVPDESVVAGAQAVVSGLAGSADEAPVAEASEEKLEFASHFLIKKGKGLQKSLEAFVGVPYKEVFRDWAQEQTGDKSGKYGWREFRKHIAYEADAFEGKTPDQYKLIKLKVVRPDQQIYLSPEFAKFLAEYNIEDLTEHAVLIEDEGELAVVDKEVSFDTATEAGADGGPSFNFDKETGKINIKLDDSLVDTNDSVSDLDWDEINEGWFDEDLDTAIVDAGWFAPELENRIKEAEWEQINQEWINIANESGLDDDLSKLA